MKGNFFEAKSYKEALHEAVDAVERRMAGDPADEAFANHVNREERRRTDLARRVFLQNAVIAAAPSGRTLTDVANEARTLLEELFPYPLPLDLVKQRPPVRTTTTGVCRV